MLPLLRADEGKQDDPDYLRWRRRVFILSALIVLSMVLPFGILLLTGVPLRSAAIWGFVIGYAAICLLNYGAETFGPERYERWRKKALRGSPRAHTGVADRFDSALGLGEDKGPNHFYLKLRLFGLTLLFVNGLIIAGIVWLGSVVGWI